MSNNQDPKPEAERFGGYLFYRSHFVEGTHGEFLQLLPFPSHMRNLPSPHLRLPLADDSSLPESQKVCFELKYLTKILESWKEEAKHKDEISLQHLLSLTVEESHGMEYEHDGLTYKTVYRMGHSRLKHGKKHYYFQVPLANNGYLYRIIEDKHALRDISLHDEKAHPGGIGGYVSLNEIGSGRLYAFSKFAVEWFGCSEEEAVERLSQGVYYNSGAKRVDIVTERFDFPTPGDRVSLEFCFEPGFPVKKFGPTTFGLTKEFLDGKVGS